MPFRLLSFTALVLYIKHYETTTQSTIKGSQGNLELNVLPRYNPVQETPTLSGKISHIFCSITDCPVGASIGSLGVFHIMK